MIGENKNGQIIIQLAGRIDSNNAAVREKEILDFLSSQETAPVVLDASDLEYTSSAGLRILLHLKKNYPDIRITNVSSDVYEILEMTGFTQIMNVEKAYRVVSIEGCEEIGRGANGIIYRIDQDNVVKVYKNADALADIQHEREVAKLALILGIPTAISYDVVKVGDSYGSVFELLNASSFSKILAREPEKFDWCVQEFVSLLKKIHETVVPDGKLPDMKETALNWASFIRDNSVLPEELAAKLMRLINDVPSDSHMIHGDYHTKNVELQGDEVLLIDMDTLSVGHPIFELGSMYNAFVGFSEFRPTEAPKFLGFDEETAKHFFHDVMAAYLDTSCEAKVQEVINKARIIGYTRLIRRSIRRKGLETEEGRAEIELWKSELIELLKSVDSLTFSRNELEIEALVENLPQVMSFIDEHLEKADCPMKAQMQISLATEEIFVNIANYAYNPDKGKAIVRIEVSDEPVTVTITFIDRGTPYDPLAKEDPDVSLGVDEREIGGLGIFLVKQTMDDVSYEYKNGQNILKLKKSL